MNFKTFAFAAVSTLACFSSVPEAKAEVKLAPIFSDNMVLQRDKPIPVWGTAKPSEKVTIIFGGDPDRFKNFPVMAKIFRQNTKLQ